jgi:hypothetical protein
MFAEAATGLRRGFIFALLSLAAGATAFAGGPRWVTGPPYFSTSGIPVAWYTNQPLYFTDPGDLSQYVNHAAADAIVAAAANVWNVPTSSLVLGYGGSLDEHVSGANVYQGPNGPVFPADVQSSNYQAKQIAVIYDSDGSVTDMLLGSGASDPSGCRQNAVTESVDSIVPAGYIQHALLILNGRCTGPVPQQQIQMQYQLMRAFGRVLGLGWSQVNDDVFTGSPQPTYQEALNWPIMHPIDIICGPYTYQCLPQPFTLRPDDLSALGMLYFIAQNQAPPGKTDTLYLAHQISGTVVFPTGQGMQGVNVVIRRWHQARAASESWQTVSAVSGELFKGTSGNPVTSAPASAAGSSGSLNLGYEGFYEAFRIPMLDGTWDSDILDTEPINPLYTGQYAVGPYIASQVQPSGTNLEAFTDIMRSYQLLGRAVLAPAGATPSCNAVADGIEAAPAAVATPGWWTGTLCAYGHAAWSSLKVKANRTLTIEVIAQDEKGFAATTKAMPVIGVWNAADALKSLPSVASASTAFNGSAYGATALTVQSPQASQFRISIADQRGDGRPDFAYQSRVLYADSVSPASVSAEGGEVAIAGMGFRAGNVVTVDGVAATVTSWTATSISATVPSSRAFGFSVAGAADVTVTDPSTRGTTTMAGALTYAAPQPSLNLVTAPSGTVFAGDTAAVAFAVRALAADGATPIANQSVSFTASGGAVQFGACAGSPCTVMTDSRGVASTTVTALEAGSITVSAVSSVGTQTASFAVVTRVQTVTAVLPVLYVAADATVPWTAQVDVSDNSASTAGVLVKWQATGGGILFSPAQSNVNSQGVAEVHATVGPLAAGGLATASACAWTNVCATFVAEGVDPADWRIEIVSGAGQSVGYDDVLAPIVLRVTDTAGDPVAGAVVEVHQTLDAWQGPCPDRGRCPVPPGENAQTSSAVSDIDGLVTVPPLQVAGIAEITNIVAATGTQGFVSLSLQKEP